MFEYNDNQDETDEGIIMKPQGEAECLVACQISPRHHTPCSEITLGPVSGPEETQQP